MYFLPVLNGLSGEERTAAIAQLPSRDGLPDITELEERPTPERLVKLAASLAAWVERAGTPELLGRYRAGPEGSCCKSMNANLAIL